MKPRDIFKLAIRLLGLLFLYHGLQAILPALGQILNAFPHELGPNANQNGDFGAFVGGVLMAGWPLTVAYCLLTWAPNITDYFYPTEED